MGKVSLLWRGKFFLVMLGYISIKVGSMNFSGTFLAGNMENAVVSVVFAFRVQTRESFPIFIVKDCVSGADAKTSFTFQTTRDLDDFYKLLRDSSLNRSLATRVDAPTDWTSLLLKCKKRIKCKKA
jgi:hypothetical protein